jgi:hypothetical protein
MQTAHCIVVAASAAVIFSLSAFAQTQEGPQRAMWVPIKKQLLAPGGDEYFDSNLKGTALPELNGTLISGLFNDGVSKIVLGLTDPKIPDVTLILHNGVTRVKGEPKPGTKIEFYGVGIDFTKDPFMLTFDVSITGIKGLEFEKTNSSGKTPPQK